MSFDLNNQRVGTLGLRKTSEAKIDMKSDAKNTTSHNFLYSKCTLSNTALKNRGFYVKYDVYN